jgi:hypothetical protein
VILGIPHDGMKRPNIMLILGIPSDGRKRTTARLDGMPSSLYCSSYLRKMKNSCLLLVHLMTVQQPRVNTQSATTSRQQHLVSPRITRTSASPGLVQFPAMCSLSPSGDDGEGYSDDSRMGEDSDDRCTSWLGPPVRGTFVWPLRHVIMLDLGNESPRRDTTPYTLSISLLLVRSRSHPASSSTTIRRLVSLKLQTLHSTMRSGSGLWRRHPQS